MQFSKVIQIVAHRHCCVSYRETIVEVGVRVFDASVSAKYDPTLNGVNLGVGCNMLCPYQKQ